MIGSRTQLGNQIRGLLAEYGIVLPLHLSQMRKALPEIIEADNALLSGFGRQLLALLYEEPCGLEQRIAANRRTDSSGLPQQSDLPEDRCCRVGPVIATAVVAAIADGRVFHNGRQFGAWVGLVPRQHSSGDKQRLSGITKRGDPHLRMLLIHGDRSVVYRAPNKNDSRNQWIDKPVSPLFMPSLEPALQSRRNSLSAARPHDAKVHRAPAVPRSLAAFLLATATQVFAVPSLRCFSAI